MYYDNFKIRISEFAWLILCNDAHNFGFERNESNTNLNGLINKLIPILLDMRKERRQLIHDLIGENLKFYMDSHSITAVRNYLDTIVDKIYFNKEYYDKTYSSELNIRPTQETINIFDEIKEHEIEIYEQNLSEYLRNLLNEYVKLPQYRREQILFKKESRELDKSYINDCICNFRYIGVKYKAVVLQQIFDFSLEQYNYVFVYDINADKIKSLFLHGISNVKCTEKHYKLNDHAITTFKHLLKNGEIFEGEVFDIIKDE